MTRTSIVVRAVAPLCMLVLLGCGGMEGDPRSAPTDAVETSSSALLTREKIVSYWATTYCDGVPAQTCGCKIGPCPPCWEIVGERIFTCTEISTWGYVNFECSQTTTEYGAYCYQSP